MAKIYCGSCGHATPYDLKKPAFCSSCGKSFSDSLAAAMAPRQPAQVQIAKAKEQPISAYRQRIERRDISDDEDDEDDDCEYRQFNESDLARMRLGISVDFSDDNTFSSQKKKTVKDLVLEGMENGPTKTGRNKANTEIKNQGDILSTWAQKNGSYKAAKEGNQIKIGKPVAAKIPEHLLPAQKPRRPSKATRASKKKS